MEEGRSPKEGLAIDDVQCPPTHIFPAGQALRVLGLTYDAMALWVLGYPDQALQRSRQAMNLAEELAQPWDLAMALGYAALVHVLRGDRQAALERAEATIQLATEQEVFSWVGRAMILRGRALAEQDKKRRGWLRCSRGLPSGKLMGRSWESHFGWPYWGNDTQE